VKNRSLAIIGVLSLALLLLAILDPWTAEPGEASGRVVAAEEVAALTRLAIEDPAEGRLEIIKGPEGLWRSADGRKADPGVVREVIAAMGLLRASRSMKPRPEHGLSADSITLVYQATGEPVRIRIGALTSDERHRWIQVDDAKALLVEAHLIGELVEARKELLSRRLLESRPRSTEALRLSREDKYVQVQEGGVSWTGYTSELPPAPLSEAAFARLRDALGDLEVRAPVPNESLCRASTKRIVLERGDQSLEMRECGFCEGGLIALWTEAQAGCVEASLWEEVTRSVERPESLVALHVLPTRKVESAFTLRCGPQELEVDPAKVDDQRLQEWWQTIDAGARSVERRVPPEHCSLTLEGQQKLIFGRIEETWYARVPNSYISRALGPEAGALLRVDATLFESLDLISEDPLFATRIEVEEGGRSMKVERSAEIVDAWRSADGSQSDGVATEWALGMRGELARLRALRFSPRPPGQGLEKAKGRRALGVDFENPVTGLGTHYQLWLVAGDAGECLAQVKGQGVVTLGAASCDRLLAPLPDAKKPER
jgi:hypothetical protein